MDGEKGSISEEEGHQSVESISGILRSNSAPRSRSKVTSPLLSPQEVIFSFSSKNFEP